jgi:hypothetical protein
LARRAAASGCLPRRSLPSRHPQRSKPARCRPLGQKGSAVFETKSPGLSDRGLGKCPAPHAGCPRRFASPAITQRPLRRFLPGRRFDRSDVGSLASQPQPIGVAAVRSRTEAPSMAVSSPPGKAACVRLALSAGKGTSSLARPASLSGGRAGAHEGRSL